MFIAKHLSTASVLIGLTGLSAIFYFNYRAELNYEALGEVREIVTLFIYGPTNFWILMVTQLIGMTMGAIAFTHKKARFGLIGSALSMLCLILLLLTPA
jgi:hypothetical protein